MLKAGKTKIAIFSLLLIAIVAIAVFASGVLANGPTTVWVDDDYNSTLCTADGHVWDTDCFDNIQDGVDAVVGSTVYVAAGTYNENVNIVTDNLVLQGAGSDVTFITPTSGRPITLVGWVTTIDNVTIEGFTLAPSDNSHGLLAGSGTPDDTYYTSNLILQDIIVEGHQRGIGLNAVNGVTLFNVYLTNISGSPEGALELTGVSNLLVEESSFENNDMGIRLQPTGDGDVGDGYGPNTNIQIDNSLFMGNTIAIQNDDSGLTIDAEDNYWGHVTGADAPGQNTGYGDSVSSNVDVCPFLDDSYPTGDSTSCYIDDDGPIVSNLQVDPTFNGGIFNITATATDNNSWSDIQIAEYFLGSSGRSSCDTPGSGDSMDATDGNYDEVSEDVEAIDVELKQDGSNWACVQAQDIQDNWGNCECVSFETDTIPPERVLNVRLNDQQNPNEYLICGEDPTLYVTICDTEADIQGGEFFLNMWIPPEQIPAPWTGYWLEPQNQYRDEGWLHCSDLEASINLTELEEGTHYINQIRGKDTVENWGKVWNQNFNYSFIKDTKAPKTDKVLNPFEDKSVTCNIDSAKGEVLTDGCYYVKQGTTITLDANDFNPDDDTNNGYNHLPGEYSDEVIIHWIVWYKLNSGDVWVIDQQGTSNPNEPVVITLDKDSYHLIEYWATDGCSWEEQHHFELDIVDTQAPELTKEIIGPQFYNETENKTYIDGVTEIVLTCVDPEPHPVNDVTIYYRYFVDDILTQNWTMYETSIIFQEESKHTLQYYCEDALGNTNGTMQQPYQEIDYVDHTKPVTTKEYGTPFVHPTGAFPKWITSQTLITLTADDGNDIHDSGVNTTYWRNTIVPEVFCWTPDSGCSTAKGSGDWNVYTGPFTKPKESCHLIEYYSVDNVNKTEEVKKQCVFVDNTPPVTTKEIVGPKYPENCLSLGQAGECWITNDSIIRLNCSDQLPHPVNDVTLHYRTFLDGEILENWTEEDGYVEIQFDEDSNHTVEWYCEDALRNTEQTRVELDTVDTEPPEIVKWVDDDTVQPGDVVEICANITDKKQTGDPGVGVDPKTIEAKLTLGDDPIQVDLEYVEGDTYCGNWVIPPINEICHEYRCVWDVWVKAEDYLGNGEGRWVDGVQIIVDKAKPKIKAMLWPSKDKYYREGKRFEVKALAIDFGGDRNISNWDNCKASGISECRFYAIKYDFESVNQSEIKNLWNYLHWLEETLDNPIQTVELGSVPFEDGFCKGSLQIPEDSGLEHEDILFMGYEIEDNAGNVRSGLGEDWDGDKITMKIDSEGPHVLITEGNLPGPFKSGDLVQLFASVEDIDSGYDECWADIFKNNGTDYVDTGYNLNGYGSGYDLCEISDTLPPGLDSGDYQLMVRVGDELQNIGSDWDYLTIDNDAPEITINSPAEDSVVGEIIPINITLTDDTGVDTSTVEYRITDCWVEAWGLCFGKKYDSGWRLLTLTEGDVLDGNYTDSFNVTAEGLDSSGTYIFGTKFCDGVGNCVGY